MTSCRATWNRAGCRAEQNEARRVIGRRDWRRLSRILCRMASRDECASEQQACT